MNITKPLPYIGAIYDSDVEGIQEWRERGMFFYCPFLKANSDRSTDATVVCKFSQSPVNNNINPAVAQTALSQAARILVFHHYKRICAVRIAQSAIVEISTYDV